MLAKGKICKADLTKNVKRGPTGRAVGQPPHTTDANWPEWPKLSKNSPSTVTDLSPIDCNSTDWAQGGEGG